MNSRVMSALLPPSDSDISSLCANLSTLTIHEQPTQVQLESFERPTSAVVSDSARCVYKPRLSCSDLAPASGTSDACDIVTDKQPTQVQLEQFERPTSVVKSDSARCVSKPRLSRTSPSSVNDGVSQPPSATSTSSASSIHKQPMQVQLEQFERPTPVVSSDSARCVSEPRLSCSNLAAVKSGVRRTMEEACAQLRKHGAFLAEFVEKEVQGNAVLCEYLLQRLQFLIRLLHEGFPEAQECGVRNVCLHLHRYFLALRPNLKANALKKRRIIADRVIAMIETRDSVLLSHFYQLCFQEYSCLIGYFNMSHHICDDPLCDGSDCPELEYSDSDDDEDYSDSDYDDLFDDEDGLLFYDDD